jgi:hypothetical protein
MRYVVLDLRGNQRESFDSQEELVAELQDGLSVDPDSLRALYVVAYEDDGREVGTRRADEVLTAVSKNGGRALLFDFTRNTVFTVAVSPSDPQYHEFATQQQAQMTTAVPGGSR